jgi:phosphate transport system substrate-binding protein
LLGVIKMNLKKAILLFAMLSLIIFIIPAKSLQSVNSSRFTHLRGSGTAMALLQCLAEEYMAQNPNEIISVTGGGTDRGIKAVIDGTAQISMASSTINPDLSRRAEEKGIKLVKIAIAYDAIVPFINPENPVSNLTVETLKKIYTGGISNWSVVGGNNSEIKLIARDYYSGTFEGWKLLVLGKDSVISPKAVPLDSKSMIKAVATSPSAIGFSAFNYLDRTVKPISVNGIPANEDTIKSGKYPLIRQLFLYSRDDLPENSKRFVEYVKNNASRFAKQAGVFPLE